MGGAFAPPTIFHRRRQQRQPPFEEYPPWANHRVGRRRPKPSRAPSSIGSRPACAPDRGDCRDRSSRAV